MKPLGDSYKHAGRTWTILKREGDVAMASTNINGYDTFEIFIVQKEKASRLPSGSVLPEREAVPKASEWGMRGWSEITREMADKRFIRVLDLVKERETRRQMLPGTPNSQAAMARIDSNPKVG